MAFPHQNTKQLLALFSPGAANRTEGLLFPGTALRFQHASGHRGKSSVLSVSFQRMGSHATKRDPPNSSTPKKGWFLVQRFLRTQRGVSLGSGVGKRCADEKKSQRCLF
jgi:hypothetical protein